MKRVVSKKASPKNGKNVRSCKLFDHLQKKAAEPKIVIWDSCCRVIDDDPLPSDI